jgi:hypothetical protein
VVVSVRLIAGNRKTGINTYESTGLKWHTKFVKDSQWERKFIKTPGFLDSKGAPDDLYIESFFNWLWGDPQVTREHLQDLLVLVPMGDHHAPARRVQVEGT